jgi:U3 small nucleolar RNA-associated protein 19
LIAEYDEKISELEKNNAISSSLWEIDSLKSHNLNSVASLSKSLEDVSSTEVGTKAPYMSVPQYIDNSYASLIEKELATIKKNSALAFKKPENLIPQGDIIKLIFK